MWVLQLLLLLPMHCFEPDSDCQQPRQDAVWFACNMGSLAVLRLRLLLCISPVLLLHIPFLLLLAVCHSGQPTSVQGAHRGVTDTIAAVTPPHSCLTCLAVHTRIHTRGVLAVACIIALTHWLAGLYWLDAWQQQSIDML